MGFLAALHFLTTVPVATRRTFTDSELGASLAYYPLVGALLGVLLALGAALYSWAFGAGIAAALTLITWVLLTGGLHLDGFMDACDGLLSHRSTEERLVEVSTRIINEAVATGPSVLVGRGAQAVLATRSDVIHVLCYAPHPALVTRVAGRLGVTLKEAERITDDTNREREEYVRKHWKRAWLAHENYHLSLNTDWLRLAAPCRTGSGARCTAGRRQPPVSCGRKLLREGSFERAEVDVLSPPG